MTGVVPEVGRPLRPSDPAELGPYRLLRRLGEGGMGSVYLAQSAEGGPFAALKMIRHDLASDADFRRRFRSEVARAQSVPAFCTAEVLDADPDFDPPYLVVEFVRGPSLNRVVQDQGPLSPANLHGLAIGVATALTAIHGAGVIHRDLKPANVLLSLSGPKVIDFGIARAPEGTALTDTGSNQLIGTIPYMAPERLDAGLQMPLTAAADVFSWGAVVCFAGTGRTPFTGANGVETAARILTQPPDLTGLSGLLRSLVERSLAKNPADRPSARELLDELVGSSARIEAASKQAVVTLAPISPAPPVSAAPVSSAPVPPALVSLAPVSPAPVSPAPTMSGPAAPVGTAPPQAISIVTAPEVAPHGGVVTAPAGPSLGVIHVVGGPVPAGRPRRKVVVPMLATLTVLLAVAVGGLLSGAIRPWNLGNPASTPSTSESPSPSPSVSPSPSLSPSASPSASASPSVTTSPSKQPFAVEAFAKDTPYWYSRDETPDGLGKCSVSNGLFVTLPNLDKTPTYRCPGDPNPFGDFSAEAEISLQKADVCAAIWTRFTGTGGYLLEVCHNRYTLYAHQDKSRAVLQGKVLTTPVAMKTKFKAKIVIQGSLIKVFHDGQELIKIVDTSYARGTVRLGISVPESSSATQPFNVTFNGLVLYDLA